LVSWYLVTRVKCLIQHQKMPYFVRVGRAVYDFDPSKKKGAK
jgi:hypothetical protein